MSDLETQGQQAAEKYWASEGLVFKDPDYLKGFIEKTVELASSDGMNAEIILNDILDEMEEGDVETEEDIPR